GAPRISRFFSGRHGHRLTPQSGGLGAFIEPQPYETVKARATKPAWAVSPRGLANAPTWGSATFRLCRFLRQVLLPLPARCEAVHLGALDEGALGGRDVFAPAGPSLLRRRLQRTAVAEGEPPRQAADAVHGVEVGGCLLVRLAAGEERDPGHGGGHAGFEQLHGFFRYLLDARTVLRLLAPHHPVWLEHPALARHLL